MGALAFGFWLQPAAELEFGIRMSREVRVSAPYISPEGLVNLLGCLICYIPALLLLTAKAGPAERLLRRTPRAGDAT